MKKPIRLYFICIENRCRSQIAEAYAKQLGQGHVIVESAGLKGSEIHPYTVEVMKEVGIDISSALSKRVDMKIFIQSNIIVKLCQQTNEKCPVVPFGVQSVQWNIPDPLHGEENSLDNVRASRDAIKNKVMELLRNLDVPINE